MQKSLEKLAATKVLFETERSKGDSELVLLSS